MKFDLKASYSNFHSFHFSSLSSHTMDDPGSTSVCEKKHAVVQLLSSHTERSASVTSGSPLWHQETSSDFHQWMLSCSICTTQSMNGSFDWQAWRRFNSHREQLLRQQLACSHIHKYEVTKICRARSKWCFACFIFYFAKFIYEEFSIGITRRKCTEESKTEITKTKHTASARDMNMNKLEWIRGAEKGRRWLWRYREQNRHRII